MEDRNPFGGSGSTDTPVKQYVWGQYIDECLQINLLAVAGPQSLPVGNYYLLQDTLYRAVGLTNSSGAVVESYDYDPYGNTLIFSAPDSTGSWWGDAAAQSTFGGNSIIYCGYRFDPETENYYVRNRFYSPTLGRWLTRDPIGTSGGINLYGYVDSSPVGALDASGTTDVAMPQIGPANLGFLPGRGGFKISVAVAPSGNNVQAVVDWLPSKLLATPAVSKCRCDRVAFVQYVEDIRVTIGGLVIGKHRYVIDTKNPYPFQHQWTTGKSQADMNDNPGPQGGGLWFKHFSHTGLRSLYMNFIDYAVCEKGREKGFSYGDVRWGFYLDWQKNFGYVFAGPALLSGNAGKVVKQRVFVQGPIGANLSVAVTDQIAEPL